jgi:Tol biopolymer transport system component
MKKAARGSITGKKPAVLVAVLISLGLQPHCEKKPERNLKPKAVTDLGSFLAGTAFRGEIVFQSDLDGDNEIYLLAGGQVKKLTDNSWSDESPRWSPDGKTIAFTSNPAGGYEVFLMNADGAGVRQLTRGFNSRIGHAGLDWLPDGKKIAFTIQKKKGIFKNYKTWTIDLATQKTGELIPGYGGQMANPDFSPAGPLLLFTGKRTIGWDVAVINLRTEETRFLTEGGKGCRGVFSGDGQSIAFVSGKADGKADIWLMKADGSGQKRLTERNQTYDYFPAWSPDGAFIAFCSNAESRYAEEGDWSLMVVEAGTGKVFPLFDSPGRDVFPDWR